jgi:hypothetical protein
MGLKMPALPARLITFLFVMTTWVIFRATNMAEAVNVYKAMFLPESVSAAHFEWGNLLFFLAGGIVVLFLKPVTEIEEKFKPTLLNCIITVTLLTVSVFFFVKYSPFIYFNF